MLWTILIVSFLLLGSGFVGSFTIAGFVHLLLVGAVAVLAIRLLAGRKVLA
jgi:hypothetical protein